MTGIYPARLGIHDYLARSELNEERGMPDYVDPEVPTVTSILKNAGYATGHFGKCEARSKSFCHDPEASIAYTGQRCQENIVIS